MRRPTFYRPMHLREEQYAWDVFKGTLPRANQIGIGDGLGLGDRPWTDKGFDSGARMPFMQYQVNLGDMASMDLTSGMHFGGFGRVCDTLIHELTHVWQYAHGDFVKTSSAAAQTWGAVQEPLAGAIEGMQKMINDAVPGLPRGTFVRPVVQDPYDYAPLDSKKAWDDYNAEQQAHIVEDWNQNGRQKTDELYPFISEVIGGNGDHKSRTQSLAELRKRLYIAELQYSFRLESLDPVLLPLLEKRYAANDVAGFGARVRKLEQIFRGLDQLHAKQLLDRFTLRKNGDKVSMYFHDHLSTAARVNLLGILRGSATSSLV